MDRISQLPGNIVDHILSYLKTPRELVRMSVLSKTWSHLTASFRILEFDINKYKSRKSFFKYVEYTTSRFCRHNLTGSRLHLATTIKKHAELDIVNRCIELLLKNGVEKLLVDITYKTNLPKYRLPNTLLSVSMLKSLSLTRCELPSHIMLEALEFKSLIFLELWYVHIDDEVIEYLTTSCPFLHTFFIIKCDGFNNFRVYGHQHLEYVRIDYDTPLERIDIEMSNLSRLVIVDCDEIGEPRVNVASCKKLRTVTYYGHLLQNTNGFINFLPNFPFVEDFSLFPSCVCSNLKLSSHSLRRLIVHSNCELEDIELNTPNLDLFVYTCSLYYLFTERHLTHFKASMECDLDEFDTALWFHELRRFLGKKNGFKAINLYINTTEVKKFRELEELKEIKLPPYELEHVELQLGYRHHDHIAFVDAVLWCCRPRSLTLISSSRRTDFGQQSDIVTFTCKKLLQQEDQGHTNIKIVSSLPSSSFLMELPHKGKVVSFIKEEVLQEAADIQRFAGLKIF